MPGTASSVPVWKSHSNQEHSQLRLCDSLRDSSTLGIEFIKSQSGSSRINALLQRPRLRIPHVVGHKRMPAFSFLRGSDYASTSGDTYGASEISLPEDMEEQDTRSMSQSTVISPAIPPPSLKVKRVDYYKMWWSDNWKYKNMNPKVVAESGGIHTMAAKITSDMRAIQSNDSWAQYCFVLVRTLPAPDDQNRTPTFKFIIKSPYLLKACQDVIQSVPGVSWTTDPVELAPELILGFLPDFEKHQAELIAKKNKTAEESNISASLGVLLEYVHRDYKSTIAKIQNLKKHGEITHDLLYSIMIPRAILITKCPITSEPRALQLVGMNRMPTLTSAIYELIVENIDAVDDTEQVSYAQWGRVRNKLFIHGFKGTVKIHSLDAYPLNYHPAEAELRQTLLTRGRKWLSLNGVHHRHYKGFAALKINNNNKLMKYNINSRVMIDRTTFRRLNPSYTLPISRPNVPAHMQGFQMPQQDYDMPEIPTLAVGTKTVVQDRDLTDDELLLTSPIVYGFSLMDKIWLEFNVEKIRDIEWNQEAFANLVLPSNRKDQLQSLVEAHTRDVGFDDFVPEKGQGLVINLFGAPGVGKTLSAESTSEHVRRPLYIIGAGDLGTTAAELNDTLERTFDIATSWRAIVLIDEADVFMEKRALNDLERNSLVAVFLRHLEYYRGILFLTTNRVKTIDEAFRSRTHVALHFKELSIDAKTQVWTAFLAKVGIKVGGEDGRITDDQLAQLAAREINGRQIKNAVRTASSLALGRNQKLAYSHFLETLDAMDDFTAEFDMLQSGE